MPVTSTMEAPIMGDLAQAIVALGRSAERRKAAVSHLIDSTDTVATAIRTQLRTGDSVEVDSAVPRSPKLPPIRVTYSATQVRNEAGQRTDALLRDDAILGVQGARGTHYDDRGRKVHPATALERELFTREVEAVVHAFRQFLDAEAGRIDEVAAQATKLTPR